MASVVLGGRWALWYLPLFLPCPASNQCAVRAWQRLASFG